MDFFSKCWSHSLKKSLMENFVFCAVICSEATFEPLTSLASLCGLNLPLREKCPNTEFFLVDIFPHLDCIWRDTEDLSVFSPNTGKYGPEKTPYLDTFYVVTGTLPMGGRETILSRNISY